jgi:hypothetical protein
LLVVRIEVLGEVGERGAVRFTVDSNSTIRGMNGEPVDVMVENFSRTGFFFSGEVDLPIGTLISVGLSGAGAREAEVVRREGAGHGCEFMVPLPRREMEKAFRGQEEVLADLMAALERSLPILPPVDFPPPPPRHPPRPGRRSRPLRR